MTANITLGPSGRVVIPKAVREKFHLSPGDTLALESEGEEIVLRPVHAKGTMRKEKGMWVIYTGKPITQEETNAVAEAIREERQKQILGSWPK